MTILLSARSETRFLALIEFLGAVVNDIVSGSFVP